MAKIGVENSLTDVQQALQQKDMRSSHYNPKMMHKDAIVVS